MKLLDASALLAYILGEPGADAVDRELDDCAMSVVNASETAEILRRKGVPIEKAISDLAAMTLPWVAPNIDTAMCAARLSVHKGLSLGDRFCIAEAQVRGAPVLTADRAWASHALGVSVELIR